jgi:hypothetical protein
LWCLDLFLCLFLRRLHHLVSHTQNGSSSLMWAAACGHAVCVRLLLDAGADKEAKNNVRMQYSASAVECACVFEGMCFLVSCSHSGCMESAYTLTHHTFSRSVFVSSFVAEYIVKYHVCFFFFVVIELVVV